MRDDVDSSITSYKNKLQDFRNEILQSFSAHTSITHLTEKWGSFIEKIVIDLFKANDLHLEKYCLVALASFGRRELQLYSDIDIVILFPADNITEHAKVIAFVQNCWDIGLDLSQQITSVDAYVELANTELTVISSLQDMRFLCGYQPLFEALKYQTHPLHIWPCEQFYLAKRLEQQKRWDKYSGTSYNLEPNVKYGVGSLRDLQLITSIMQRHFGFEKFIDLLSLAVISAQEYEKYLSSLHFLLRVRFGLHVLAKKREDRILFNHQKQLASLFGYEDCEEALGVEQFMQNYFKISQHARELTEMLLQWFAETFLSHQTMLICPINARFQLVGHLIETRNKQVFKIPEAMIELFSIMAHHPHIKGVRADTIRQLQQHLHRLPNSQNAPLIANRLFLSIFDSSANPYLALDFMSRFGALGHYLACFAKVSGQMQYDLYHAYTVDQHTLFVIRNIGNFLEPDSALDFPLAAKIMQTLPKRSTLYLAALFHDIAKGRGGNHSLLGAEDAKQFAQIHQLNAEDAALLEWLVRHHLLMSSTIHRQDIHDPLVINQFCGIVCDEKHLDYLYLLTVADICATNPALWNAWKASLLKTLYHNAKRSFQTEKGLIEEANIVDTKLKKAKILLRKKGFSERDIDTIWKNLKQSYFLHESPKSIALHTSLILANGETPLIHIMPHHGQGGTEIFIYTPHCDERFMICTSVLCNHAVTIQEAYISTCENHYNLDTYIVLSEGSQTLLDDAAANQIKAELSHYLGESKPPRLSKKRLSRVLAHFHCPTEVSFTDIPDTQMTALFLISADRPGLLAHISRIFYHEKIQLINAKIATFGERVEDVFYVMNTQNEALSTKEKEKLSRALCALLP